MLQQVDIKNEKIKGSLQKVKGMVKRVYYQILMVMYSFCGIAAKQIATNSSWTDDHI